eukprot:CCRYP_004559-RB/>CCRYP_004559-RB protein AED:0.02 eAED:0.02 QI:71/1/1/1/1/0.83/6/35/2055
MTTSHPSSTIEISPLTILHHHEQLDTKTNRRHRIVDSFQLLANHSCHSPNDNGDILAYITTAHVDGETKRQVAVDRMDGTRIASFDLPPLNGNGDKNHGGNARIDEVEEWTFHHPILCWTSFRGDARSNMTKKDNNDDDDDDDNERKMLCVLANPTTLQIYDVLGDIATASPNDTDKRMFSSGGGPSGHTVPLPFRACGLYSIHARGLLILRAPSREDGDGGGIITHGSWKDDVAVSPQGLSIPGTPPRSSRSFRNVVDDGVDRNLLEEELQLPPEPVRINFHDELLRNSEDEDVATAVPSLFSLCHPLDEIRPVAQCATDSQFIDIKDVNKSELFTDISERLVYTGVPRLFPRCILHGGDETEETSIQISPICVTYNQTLKRHAIWSLEKSAEPAEALPLWKTTGRGTWRNVLREKADGTDEDRVEGKEDSDDGSNSDYNEEDKGFPSSFSDIYPDFTMNLLYSELVGSSPRRVGSRHSRIETDEMQSSQNSCRRRVFLATDVHGTGDLILCILMPNDRLGTNSDTAVDSIHEPAILRRFLLHPGKHRNNVLSSVCITSVSPLVDLPCTSAIQIQSIPIPLAPFSMTKSGCRRSSRFHPADVNAMANDVLVVRKVKDSMHNGDHAAKLSLFRSGAIHIGDLVLPPNGIDDDWQLLRLENSVGDRVDLVFGDREPSKSVTVRASISLIMHTSPITETALRAIESSLIPTGHVDANNEHKSFFSFDSFDRLQTYPASWFGAALSLMIRSDCISLFQRLKMDHVCPNMEDYCWYSLTLVLLNLLVGFDHGAVNSARQTRIKSDSSPKSAWEELLQSDFHATFSQGEGRFLFDESILKSTIQSSKELKGTPDLSSYVSVLSSGRLATIIEGDSGEYLPTQKYKNDIFDALHLLHEDSRLLSQSRGSAWTRRLGSFLLHLCELNQPCMVDFEDHYYRLLGRRCLSNACNVFSENTYAPSRLTNFVFSPCIMTCLYSIIQHDSPDFTPEDVHFEMAGYKDANVSGLNGNCSTSWMVLRLFGVLLGDDTFGRNNVEPDFGHCSLPSRRAYRLVRSMLDEGIYQSSQLQDELPIGVSYPLMEAIRKCRLNPPRIDLDCWPRAAYDLVGRNDLAALLSEVHHDSVNRRVETTGVRSNVEDTDKDGLIIMEEYSSMIFPEDNRIREAARLLRSSRSLFLRVPRPVELSDHEYERSKQEKLLLLCRRSIALPLGRGMLTLGTNNVQSAEQLYIPNIVLAGRVPPTNGTLALDMSSCPPNFRVWPEFHNGVAAGLRLPRVSSLRTRDRTITRTWIKYNKPVIPQQQESGSSNSPAPSTPSYAHGGFLMALGLRGYLSALTTTDLTDYLTQGTITTTVGIFLGMAANKRGSCDPSVSKMLCLHIPSLLPPSFTPMDIASSVQAAAIAGIGLLYQGSAHRLMTEFLLNEIGRQPVKDQNANDKEGFALVCGLALGMVNLQKGTSTLCGLEDLRIEERLQRYIFGSTDEISRNQRRYAAGSNAGGISSEIDRDRNLDTYSINRDITAPGATLALGLMYIKSHNVSVASVLNLPDTHFQLDYVRPDLLALRVISRSLILWDDVQPSRDWIDAQIPSIVKRSIDFMKQKAMAAGNLDSGNENRPTNESNSDVSDFDPQAVRQANAFIVAGACFSLGLRFAGSANRTAAAAIFERVLYFLELRDNKDVVTLVQRPDTPTLVTCLCTAAISLAMVMAGTGDLDSFRLFRALRWRCEDVTLYGTHMAFGAAIGLLFLGGGKCTLGSSPQDVAMLIVAFFPHFPILSSDNQYHLQALRHLYVLATYERVLESVDIDSGEKVCIPIELSLSPSKEMIEVSTPYLLAIDAKFSELRTKSDRYYPIVMKASNWNGTLPTLFVKRRPGHLSYLQDPNALRSLSIQTEGESFLKSISLFSNDPTLISFAEYFCPTHNRRGDVSFERFCNEIAHECMNDETTPMLPYYLTLFRLMDSNSCSDVNVQNVWDVRLLRSYAERNGDSDDVRSGVNHLLSCEFIALVCQKLDDLFMSCGISGTKLSSLARMERWWEEEDDDADSCVGRLFVWSDVPKKCHNISLS